MPGNSTFARVSDVPIPHMIAAGAELRNGDPGAAPAPQGPDPCRGAGPSQPNDTVPTCCDHDLLTVETVGASGGAVQPDDADGDVLQVASVEVTAQLVGLDDG